MTFLDFSWASDPDQHYPWSGCSTSSGKCAPAPYPPPHLAVQTMARACVWQSDVYLLGGGWTQRVSFVCATGANWTGGCDPLCPQPTMFAEVLLLGVYNLGFMGLGAIRRNPFSSINKAPAKQNCWRKMVQKSAKMAHLNARYVSHDPIGGWTCIIVKTSRAQCGLLYCSQSSSV